MFHLPTFHYRLYLNRVSPVLLDAIYALAARFCDHAIFLSTFPAETPACARGEAFADRAHLSARHMIAQHAIGSAPHVEKDRESWEEIEFAQALYLLGVYFTCTPKASIGSFYLDSALSILRQVFSGSTAQLVNHSGLDEIEYLTLKEAQRRTLWMVMIHNFVGATDGRPKSVLDREIYHIPLPGGEAHWSRRGGASADGQLLRRRHGITGGDGNWPGTDGQIEELGYLIRIVRAALSLRRSFQLTASSSRSSPTS